MDIWCDRLPTICSLDAADGNEAADFCQLFVSTEVVTDVVEMNLTVSDGIGILYQEENADGSTASRTKNLATFTFSALACSFQSTQSAQMENVDARELINETFA